MKEIEEEIKRLRYELMVTIPDELKNAFESGSDDGTMEISNILVRQDLINIRLNQLIHRIDSYKKINIKKIPLDKVSVGSLVKVNKLKENTCITFLITYPEFMIYEENNYNISYIEVTANSPIGKSLMNKSVGDVTVAHLPDGTVLYSIIELHPLYAFKKVLDFE